MDDRKQFTFYVSIYNALKRIRKKQDRADAYDLICEYALFQKEPNLESVPDSVAIAFECLKPVLDASRKKAENGKQGGSKTKANDKQNESKPKQTVSEKEGEEEKEVENEIEIEVEKEKESLFTGAAGDFACARTASESELESIGIKPGEFYGITADFVEDVRKTTMALFCKYLPGSLPQPWDYRQVSQYCGVAGRSGLLDYAFEKAAVAGKLGDWRYIDGIMDRLFARGIETEAQARDWDLERPDLDNIELSKGDRNENRS